MRILYFHQYFSTPHGATGTRSYEMARRLISQGHEVLMVCGTTERGESGLRHLFRRGRRQGRIDGIEIIEFDLGYSNRHGFLRRTLAFLQFAVRSIAIALTARYDIVFATTTPLTASLPGIAARWIRRKPFVFEVRDLWPELPRAMGVITNPLLLGAMSMLEWVSYHSADRLIALAPGIATGIERRGIARDRIALIPNGCDIDLFSSDTPTDRPDPIPSDAFMAIFAGAHGPANGLDNVLAAAAVVQARGREDIRIVLIGEGKCKRDLQRTAAALALRNVVFLPKIPKSQLVGLLASADVGLQVLANVPAFYLGTSPNKFFDYLAAGRPVIINYPGWLADLVREHECGWVVAPDHPDEFADALIAAADRRGELAALGHRARQLAETRFSRAQLGAQFVDWVADPRLAASRARPVGRGR